MQSHEEIGWPRTLSANIRVRSPFGYFRAVKERHMKATYDLLFFFIYSLTMARFRKAHKLQIFGISFKIIKIHFINYVIMEQ